MDIKKIFIKATLLPVLTLLVGCAAQPLLTITDRDVAAVLQPLSHANIIDSRGSFRSLYCQVNEDHGRDLPDYRECDEALFLLPDEKPASVPEAFTPVFNHRLRLFVVPGIFAECLLDEVSPFSHAIDHLNQYPGIQASLLPGIRGRASSSFNSTVINDFLENYDKDEDEKIVVIAYSKGTTDMLSFLSRPEENAAAIEKVDALVSVAGVVNGTPLADDTNALLYMLAEHFPFDRCPVQDESGVRSLTREMQLLRLSRWHLPGHIRYFSLAAYAVESNISTLLKPSYRRLSLSDPRNDSQVIYYDAVLPGAHLLGYANADHWAIALPFARNRESLRLISGIIASQADKNDFPREVLLESIARFVDSRL